MHKYPKETVMQVLAASDIKDLVGTLVDLKHAGSGRYKGLCPFHNEKTPSFTVSVDRQQFHCFGCGKHGDAISFLEETEGLSFSEALRKLADRAGIRLPALTEADDKEEYLRTQLIEFGKFARRFFEETLAHPEAGRAARTYLDRRGLKPETMKRFSLGFAPDAWSTLLDKARAAKFRDNVLEASGLFRRGDRGSLYDFFRNRLMIPIRDISGNTVAFGGRDLGDGVPKYINSPENTLYKKSRVLYGLHEARDAVRQNRRLLLVEGYFDMMRCFDAGIENVVASCGTALTPEQASLIRRYSNEVVIVFDADPAGIKAALRGIGILVNAGLTVRALTVPNGKDPDDFVRQQGPEAFQALVDESMDFVTFYTRMNRENTVTIEGRTAVAREVFTMLRDVDDTMRQGEYLKRLATELGLHPWKCEEEFRRFLQQRESAPQRSTNTAPAKLVSPQDCDFIWALMHEPRHLASVKLAMTDTALPQDALGEVLRALFEQVDGDAAQRLTSDDARRLYAAAAVHETSHDKAAEAVEKRINQLRKDALRREADRIAVDLAEAERARDQERLRDLLGRKLAVERQRQAIGSV